MEKTIKTDKEREYDLYKRIAFVSLGIGVLILVVFCFILLENYTISTDFDHKTTQTVGVFIGGVVPVFISIATVLLVYITFKSNREEFIKINEANDKIIEANNFQQFNTTFDSMSTSLEKVIENYNTKKVFKNYVNGCERNAVKMIEIKMDISKFLERDIESNESKLPPESAENKIILEVLKEMNYSSFGIEMSVLNSAVLIIFKYLESNLKLNSNLRANQEYYIFRIIHLISNEWVRKTLMFNGFVNEQLKNLIDRYGLIRGLSSNLSLKFYTESGSRKKNDPIYLYYLLLYYDKSAFHKEE